MSSAISVCSTFSAKRMVTFEKVTVSFGEHVALNEVTLSLPQGRTIALIGPSGCGKSTLLRLLLFLISPTRGRVRVADRDVNQGNAIEIRRRIGYVVQDGGLFPHMTVRDNVLLMARYLGYSEETNQARLAWLCELTKFPEGALARYPVQLSGGQRQRVSLMRALILDPELLLLDEPLAALDPIVRANLQQELRAIFQRLQRTVVLVTHDMAEAAYFGDRIVLLESGRVVQVGTFQALWESPAEPFVSDFLAAQRTLSFL